MKKIMILVFGALILAGCKRKETEPEKQQNKVVLTSPADNSICLTGTVLSALQSIVTLKWEPVTRATGYVVTVKNLATGTSSTFTTAETHYEATLNRGTPYAWTVAAQAASAEDASTAETWKFYNAGLETVSYAPFPADNLLPGRNQTINLAEGKITLRWTGSDADNDILNYDIYLGTTISPPLLMRDVSESKLQNVSLSAGSTYYWKVLTRDKMGNTSESEVVNFTVR